MRHKHADLIHAWAEGATIQYKSHVDGDWRDFEHTNPSWLDKYEYRIKLEKNPDDITIDAFIYPDKHSAAFGCGRHNLRCTFDGITGELKSAEVIK